MEKRGVVVNDELLNRLLDCIEHEIYPLTAKAVQKGNKIFGAAILDKANPHKLVIAETNNETANPMWHGETHCIKCLYERISNPPAPRDCIFLSTHEVLSEVLLLISSNIHTQPCTMCLSAITWSGYDNFFFLFSHEDSRDQFNIPHDLRILKEVFKLNAGEYNSDNFYWNSCDIRKNAKTDTLKEKIDKIEKLYAQLSETYQKSKGSNKIPLD